jgi:phage terminase Nu1 subunit (DNA packaging protein)
MSALDARKQDVEEWVSHQREMEVAQAQAQAMQYQVMQYQVIFEAADADLNAIIAIVVIIDPKVARGSP